MTQQKEITVRHANDEGGHPCMFYAHGEYEREEFLRAMFEQWVDIDPDNFFLYGDVPYEERAGTVEDCVGSAMERGNYPVHYDYLRHNPAPKHMREQGFTNMMDYGKQGQRGSFLATYVEIG